MAGEWDLVSVEPSGGWTPVAEPPQQTVGRGLGLGTRGVLEGATALPGMVADAVSWPIRAGARALGATVTAPSDLIQRGIDATGLPKPVTAGELLADAGVRGATAAITTAGFGGVPGLPAPVANALMRGPTAQVVGGATGGVTSEVASQLKQPPWVQMVAGLVGGVGGALAVPGAARLATPIRSVQTPEQLALVEAARREGIPLSVGQETGSRTLKTMESALAQLPGSSGGEAAARVAQQRAFNRAVLARAGVDADIATPDVLNRAKTAIGGEIGEIAERNTLSVSAELVNNLSVLERELATEGMSIRMPVQARINEIKDMIRNNNGEIPGSAFRKFDADMTKRINATTDGDRRNLLTQVRDMLRGGFDDSISEADAAAWADARRRYANLNVAADAAGGAGAATAEGNISPLALRGALDRSTGGGYVWGRGDTNELARIGQSVLRPAPDPGTAGHMNWMQMLQTGSAGGGFGTLLAQGRPFSAAAALVAPYVLPRLVQGAVNSTPGRAYLTNQLAAGVQGNPMGAFTGVAADQRHNQLSPAEVPQIVVRPQR